MAAVVSVVVAWGVAQWDYLLPRRLTVSEAAAPVRHDHGRPRRDRRSRCVLIVPAFVLLYVLDQKTLLPEESMPEPLTNRPQPR